MLRWEKQVTASVPELSQPKKVVKPEKTKAEENYLYKWYSMDNYEKVSEQTLCKSSKVSQQTEKKQQVNSTEEK